MLDANAILDLLHQIEAGQVTLTVTPETRTNPNWSYNGVAVYETSNGFLLGVFVDAGYWDYLDWAEIDGETWYWGDDPRVDAYRPNQAVIKRQYRLELDHPFYAETWVQHNWTTHELHCTKWGAKELIAVKKNMTATEYEEKDAAFRRAHYQCNPIYGPNSTPG